MRYSRTIGVAALASGVIAATLVAAPQAVGAERKAPAPVVVKAKGLDGPFGIAKWGPHGFVVAESVTGEVTRIDGQGRSHTLVSGAPGVAGVATGGERVYSVLGGPNEEGAPSGGKYAPSSVLKTNVKKAGPPSSRTCSTTSSITTPTGRSSSTPTTSRTTRSRTPSR